MTLAEIDHATQDAVVARRNFLVGVWAGRQLGLEHDELALYASQVMAADLDEPGPYDVVVKVSQDLRGVGIPVSEGCVLRELMLTERSVRAELIATD